MKIVFATKVIIDLKKHIDEVIDAPGGWPIGEDKESKPSVCTPAQRTGLNKKTKKFLLIYVSILLEF